MVLITIWAFCNRKGGNCREKPILHLYAKYDFWAEICPEIVLTQKKIFPAVSPLFIAKGPYNHSKHKGQKYICRYCLHVYSSEIRYNEHLPKCKGLNNAPQQPQMPVKNRSVKAF